MLKTDLGGVVYQNVLSTASINVSPIADRAARVRRWSLTNPSASDDWQVIVGGREIMRFRNLNTGNQRLFRGLADTARVPIDFFEYVRGYLGLNAEVPVPKGLTFTIQSVGGATADIDVEFYETTEDEGNIIGYNHYAGNQFIVPIWWRLNASQSSPATVQLDTQTAPPWYPALMTNTPLPPNWKVELLAWFLEGAGINTFSGAANHQSTTDSLRVFRNQVQFYSRTGVGIPARGSDSAAGSANTVLGTRSGVYPPFELQNPSDDAIAPVPLTLAGGDALQLLWTLTGDLTGGASYANALVAAIARVTVPPGSFGAM